MTPKSEQHLRRILTTVAGALERKYRAGNEAHGGDLLDMTAEQLIDEAIAESYDQITYLLTLKEKLGANCIFTEKK